MNGVGRRLLQHTPLMLFVAVFVLFGLLAPGYLEYQSLENVVKQASYIGIVAAGMTVVLLTAGIDLSVGANMYVSTVVAGLLMQRHGVEPEWAFLACLVVGGVFGAVNALAVTRLKIAPFIVTLATLVAGRGVGLMLSQSRAIPFPEPVLQLGSARVFGVVPFPIVVFGLVVLAVQLFLRRTPMGRRLYAVGYDASAAEKAGIDVGRTLAVVYVLCGLLAALGGFVSVTQVGIVNPGFGEGREFDVIAAAVLGGASLFGGRGDVFPGTVLGALLIQMVLTGLVFMQVDIYLQPLVLALIILLAVLLDSMRSAQLQRLERRHVRRADEAGPEAGASREGGASPEPGSERSG